MSVIRERLYAHPVVWSFMILTKHKYYSDNQVEYDEMGGACGTNGERAGERRFMVKKPAGQRPV
jgi:hypothetical protein